MKTLEFTISDETIIFILDKLRLKPLSIDGNRVKLRKVSSLKRIQKYLSNHPIDNKYNTYDYVIDNTDKHQWIDIWVNDKLITFLAYK